MSKSRKFHVSLNKSLSVTKSWKLAFSLYRRLAQRVLWEKLLFLLPWRQHCSAQKERTKHQLHPGIAPWVVP